jgi:predicted transcriptional regulator
MSDSQELDRRRIIYDCIAQHPGVNLSKIAELLQLSTQLVDYHLLYLEKHELITIEKEGGYKRCYAKGKIGLKDKRILSVLRQEIPLKIVMFLLKNPYSRHRDILRYLQTSSARFSYHLRKLVRNGIITESTRGKKTGYIISNKKEVIEFLIVYRPSNILTSVRETWEDFAPGMQENNKS